MSLLTLYQSQLDTRGLTSIAFSQSGRSPDLILPTQQLRSSGARTVAVVNGRLAAGRSRRCAAAACGRRAQRGRHKSHIAQLVAGARLVAAWQAERL